MQKVYFISGLGADRRAFSFLHLSFCQPVFIKWPPFQKNDTLPSYAEKVFQSINDESATIIGLSFGGMLATEIAKNHPNTKVILISSCKTYKEIPGYLRIWKYFPVYKFYSNKLKKFSGLLTTRVLGVSGKEERKVQLQILKDSDPPFTRWAIGAILHWRNLTIPKNIIHIHGTADQLLPMKYVKADYSIIDGTHVMVMDKATQVSAILKTLINEKAGET